MAAPATDPVDLVRVIQAATAPVGLISAVGLLLLVLTNRSEGIADRSRQVAAERRGGRPELAAQLTVRGRRARLIRLAVGLSAGTVVLVGLLITRLFVGAIVQADVVRLAITSFIVAMLALARRCWSSCAN